MAKISTVAASAPGKVLFTGGFLVLDRNYTGLVLGLNARIHVHIQPLSGLEAEHESATRDSIRILVQSPQFRDAVWVYKVGISPLNGEAVSIEQLLEGTRATSRNKFVEITLQYALTYLLHTSNNVNRNMKISIIADNDYYSQSTATSITPKHGFNDFGVNLNDAHKTGLGSSAALVTSMVAALLSFHTGETFMAREKIHNLAQAAHCAAQGKVGSGFDVAAAVYGSCLYRRFSPAILEEVGEPTVTGFEDRLRLCIDDFNPELRWNVDIANKAVNIPNSLLLVMCDVDCGSQTPGMVKQVLQWRKEHQKEADRLWNAIQQESFTLCYTLKRLTESNRLNMDDQQELCDCIARIRAHVREMSKQSGVPIEPDVITELLDFCTGLPGVIGGVAPGAGGYDAVALLVRNDSEIVRDLETRLDGWTSSAQGTGTKIGKVRLLKVKQESEGVHLEDVERYGSWVSEPSSA